MLIKHIFVAAVHFEPYNSQDVFTWPAKAKSAKTEVFLPDHAPPQSFITSAGAREQHSLSFLGEPAPSRRLANPQPRPLAVGVLMSSDGGDSWRLGGVIEDSKHWVIQPALCRVGARKLLALMRTDGGWVFCSRSTDGGTTWSRSAATSIPNPNAKIAALQWGTEVKAPGGWGGRRGAEAMQWTRVQSFLVRLLLSPFPPPCQQDKILLVHHTTQKKSSSLALSLSDDQGYSFSKLVEMESAEGAAEPSSVLWAANTVKVVYAVAGTLRLATLNLSQSAAA